MLSHNLVFKPQRDQVPDVEPMNVTVDGHILGEITPHRFGSGDEITWMSAFKLPSGGLAQGGGATPEEAVLSAIVDTRQKLKANLVDLHCLELKLTGFRSKAWC